MEALAEFAQLFNAASHPLDVSTLEQLVSLVTQRVPTTFCRLLLWDGEALEVKAAGTLRPIDWQPGRGHRYLLSQYPLMAEIMASGKPRVFVRGETPAEPLEEASRDFGLPLGAVGFLPLIGRSRTIGLMVLGEQRFPPRVPYHEEVITLYSLVARLVALELEHNQTEDLFRKSQETLQQRLEDLQFIHQSSLALVSDLDLRAALEPATEDLFHLLGAHSVFIFRLEGERLKPLVWRYQPDFYQVSEAELLPLLPARLGQGITGWAAQHGESILAPDVRLEPHAYVIEGVERDEESFLAVPLKVKGKVCGVIVSGKDGINQYGPRELRLVEAFAAPVAVAMENARLYQVLQERERLLESLVKATRRITSQTEIETLLVTILDLAVEVVPGAQSGSILVREGDQFAFRGAIGYDLKKLQRTTLPLQYALRRFPQNQAALLFPPLGEDLPPDVREVLDIFGRNREIQVILSAPIYVRGELYGFFNLENFERSDAFSREAQDALWLFAQQAAVAVENALLFHEREVMVQQLERDLEKIGQLSRAKEDFFYTVSHELKTPLMVAASSLDLLLTHRDEPNQVEEYGSILGRHLKRLLTLIENILVTARGEISSNLALRSLDLVALLHGEVETARILGHTKGLSWEEHYHPSELRLSLDEDYVRQAISNLLTNAVKFSRPGGRIVIRLTQEAATVLICVADEGLGIPEEDLPNLFQRFYRASNARQAATAGTGLGLYTTRLIVEGHGGRVWLESEPERGTQAWIRLPLA